MDPELSFQKNVADHLQKIDRRTKVERQNQNWTVEIFRQSSVNSIRSTHMRDTVVELERISVEVKTIVQEIEGLLPVIVWIWDQIRTREDLLIHLSAIEDRVRDMTRHHNRHGHFYEMYDQNSKNGLMIFKSSIQNLVSLFNQGDNWIDDPVQALRRIHDAQDGVVLTGLFLELILETVTASNLLKPHDIEKLTKAIGHMSFLGQRLHLKEERLSHCINP